MKKKRNKTAHGCLQLLAVPIVIAFIITAVSAVLMTGTSFTFASRTSIKSAINADKIIREIMVRGIEQDIRQKHLALNLPPPAIDLVAIRHATDLVVPPDWVENAVDDGIDNVFNFLEEGRTEDYVLGYKELVETFHSDAGREAMHIIVRQYPPCPASYEPTFEYKERNVEIECLPPDMPVSQVADQIYTTLLTGFNNDPEILDENGGACLEWPADLASNTESIRRAFQYLSRLWLFWLIPMGLLAVIALLTVRSLYSAGIWLGIPLLITGVTTPIVGLVIFVQILNLLQYAQENLGTSEDRAAQLLIQFVTEIAYALPSIWLVIVLIQAGIMFLLGAGSLVLAVLLKLFNRDTRPKKSHGMAGTAVVNH
ncbi:MAG: hypothetical protein KDJ52_19820 [Anaerolineae bacterium]|nr:hypothetical protein [Anaerolineae bacterium]